MPHRAFQLLLPTGVVFALVMSACSDNDPGLTYTTEASTLSRASDAVSAPPQAIAVSTGQELALEWSRFARDAPPPLPEGSIAVIVTAGQDQGNGRVTHVRVDEGDLVVTLEVHDLGECGEGRTAELSSQVQLLFIEAAMPETASVQDRLRGGCGR